MARPRVGEIRFEFFIEFLASCTAKTITDGGKNFTATGKSDAATGVAVLPFVSASVETILTPGFISDGAWQYGGENSSHLIYEYQALAYNGPRVSALSATLTVEAV